MCLLVYVVMFFIKHITRCYVAANITAKITLARPCYPLAGAVRWRFLRPEKGGVLEAIICLRVIPNF